MSRTGNAPSVAWFYDALSLAAHDAIFERRSSFHTYGDLGLSHQKLLFHMRKIAVRILVLRNLPVGVQAFLWGMGFIPSRTAIGKKLPPNFRVYRARAGINPAPYMISGFTAT